MHILHPLPPLVHDEDHFHIPSVQSGHWPEFGVSFLVTMEICRRKIVYRCPLGPNLAAGHASPLSRKTEDEEKRGARRRKTCNNLTLSSYLCVLVGGGGRGAVGQAVEFVMVCPDQFNIP